ncbi:MAG: proton-conducting transporter membrane subunit [Anaerolineales bacterium]
MSAPLLLLGWNAIAAALALAIPRLQARWHWWAPAACVAIMLGILILPLDAPWEILGQGVKLQSDWVVLGRALVLDGANRLGLACLYFGAAILFALGGGKSSTRAHAVSAWSMLGLLSSALMIHPFLLAAVLLELAALAGAVLMSEEGSVFHEASMRLVTVATPAMLVVLLAGWFVETAGVTSATPDLANSAATLLLFGFAILLAIPPFHLWLPPAVRASGGVRPVLILVVLQTTGMMLALRFLDSYDWLRNSDQVFRGIRLVGLLATCVGAAVALAETDSRKSTVYSVLADSGSLLLALGLPGGRGVPIAVALTALRLPGVGLATAGWGWEAGAPERASVWQARANLYGRLALAGFPLTPAFGPKLMLFMALSAGDGLGFAVLLLSSLAIMSAALRSTRRVDLLRPEGVGTSPGPVYVAGLALGIGMSLFPTPWIQFLVRAAAGLANLVP